MNVAINSWIIFWLTYWSVGGMLTWYTNKFKKVERLPEVITVLITNMFWTLLGVVFLCFLPLRALTNTHIIIKLFLTYFITDIYFYHVHIMLHHPQLYSALHKMHHSFQNNNYSLVALYCTPYEAIFLNVFAVSWGPVIFQIPPPYIYIWFNLVAFNSVFTHSGLNIPYVYDNLHDIHHKLFNYNYGTSVYLDKIYGTFWGKGKEDKNENEDEHKDLKEFHLGNFPINVSNL